jgi:hypothetical protein
MSSDPAYWSILQFLLLNVFAYLLASLQYGAYVALATNLYICVAAIPAYGLVLVARQGVDYYGGGEADKTA